jgi:hypothetical protein
LERQATLQQIASIREVASTADDHSHRRLWYRSSPTRNVLDVRGQAEQLLCLAFTYMMLGHHTKAGHRVQRARETLAELKELMDLDVWAMISFPGTRTGIDVPMRQDARRRRYREELSKLNGLCAELESAAP